MIHLGASEFLSFDTNQRKLATMAGLTTPSTRISRAIRRNTGILFPDC
jgi:hypothetical protein